MAQQQNVNVNIPFNRHATGGGMRSFFEHFNENPRNTAEVIYTQLIPVDFYLPDTPQHASAVVNTCMSMIRELVDNPKGLISNHLAIICCIFPDLADAARTVLLHSSAQARNVLLPSQAVSSFIQMSPPIDHKLSLFIFAQCVLIIYKNISPQSYLNFMTRRNTALMAEIGFHSPVAPIVYDYDEAKLINANLGREDQFRRQLLQSVIEYASETTPLGNTCAYIFTILSWTEMSALTFIYETLLTTRSPVLLDQRVASEVINLHAAYRLVCSQPYPQFFKIMASPIQKKKLDRAKFPILLSVAQRLMSNRQSTVSQFIMPAGRSDALVEELVQLHLQHEQNRDGRNILGFVQFLTDVGDAAGAQEEVHANPL